MKTRLQILDRKLDQKDMASESWSAESGAVVTFLGAVRAVEERQKIKALEYETHRDMAEYQFKMLFEELERRWKLESIEVIHRIGTVPVGEISLFVRVIATHRQEAFAACQFFIDQLKLTLPIWKKPVS
jgi:molybdopterin synthase catalytic subunit